VRFYFVRNKNTVLKDIHNDRMYGLLTDIPDAIQVLKEQTIGSVHIGGKFEEDVGLSFGLSQNNVVLRNILNKLISGITKSQHNFITSDFSSLNYKEVINYDLILKIAGVSAVFIIFLIIFLAREKKLKLEILKLNEGLNLKIKKEVALSREKDAYIFKQAKHASMGEMIANIAHQWRQPLNRINVSSQVISTLLDQDCAINKDMLSKQNNTIGDNIIYMSDTINDFSKFFHPNKKMNLFNLNDAISKSLVLIQGKTIDIDFNVDIDTKINLKNYENELIQVVMVLLDNSIYNFSTTDIENKKIDVYTREVNSFVQINVIDNGGGIPEEILDRIFEPYFSTKFEDKNSGIGLYMAKMLIEESMRGKIYVATHNGYTHFEINLPMSSVYNESNI